MREEDGAGAPVHTSPALREGIALGEIAGHVRHTITTNRLEVAVYRATAHGSAKRGVERWVPLKELHLLPVTTITRKALRLTGDAPPNGVRPESIRSEERRVGKECRL